MQVEARNQPKFLRQAALLFNDRCHEQELLRGAQRQVGIEIHPGRVHLLAQRAVGLAKQIDIGGARNEPIGLRQELALRIEPWKSKLIHEIRRIGGQGELDIRIVPHGLEQILHSPAVDNGEGVQKYLTVYHFRQQVTGRRSGLNFIFPRLDRRRESPQSSISHPGSRLGNHAPCRQVRRNMREARARTYLEPYRRRELQRLVEAANSEPDHGGRRAEQQHAKYRDDAPCSFHNRSNLARSSVAVSKSKDRSRSLPRPITPTDFNPTTALLMNTSSASRRSRQRMARSVTRSCRLPAVSMTQRRITPATPQRSSAGVSRLPSRLKNKLDMVPQTMFWSTSCINPSQIRASRHSLRATTDSRRFSDLRPARCGLSPSGVAQRRTRTGVSSAARVPRGRACSVRMRVHRSRPVGR